MGLISKIRNSEWWRAISDLQMAWELLKAIGIAKLGSALISGGVAWFGALSQVPPIFAVGFGIFIFACVLWILNGITWKRDQAEIRKSFLRENEAGRDVDALEETDRKQISEVITNREINLYELITLDFRIINKTFIDCVIKGPAVIYLVRTALIECGFIGTQETVFIPLSNKKYVTGLIMLKDCTFRRCTFQFVAIGAADEAIPEMLKGFSLPAPEQPESGA